MPSRVFLRFLASRRHPARLVFITLASMGTLLSSAAAGQTGTASVHGLVIDARNGKPVASAQVTLLEAGRSAETSDRGRFAFTRVPAGTHTILVQRIGYGSRSEQIQLNPGQAIDVTIGVTTEPVELEPIEVVTRSGKLAEVGYYDRRDNGGLSGHYITYDDLVRRNAMGLTDVLVDVPSVRTIYLQPGRTTVRFNRHVPEVGAMSNKGRLAFDQGGNSIPGCEPDLYIDGRLYRNASPPIVTNKATTTFSNETMNKVDDFNAIPVSQIDGVEVYVGAAVPPFVYNTACGVILVWTRR